MRKSPGGLLGHSHTPIMFFKKPAGQADGKSAVDLYDGDDD